jgi:hypothetical protein
MGLDLFIIPLGRGVEMDWRLQCKDDNHHVKERERQLCNGGNYMSKYSSVA